MNQEPHFLLYYLILESWGAVLSSYMMQSLFIVKAPQLRCILRWKNWLPKYLFAPWIPQVFNSLRSTEFFKIHLKSWCDFPVCDKDTSLVALLQSRDHFLYHFFLHIWYLWGREWKCLSWAGLSTFLDEHVANIISFISNDEPKLQHSLHNRQHFIAFT